ncbi:MAG: hypothetical protein CMD06_04970 [Flavobacteriales bacterium]|nr:hypothetical protein [Flavobacteriales bacterium]
MENKIKLKLSLFSLLYLMFNYNLYSQDDLNINELSGGDKLNTITTAVPFLMISPDSRSGAMGDVGVATSPDANSLHWNPAKFAFIEDEVGFAVSYVPWLRALVPDINLSYLTGYKKFNKNESIGAELRYFSLGNIVFTNQAGDVVGQGNPHELALATAYSRKLSRDFSLAISGRYIFSNLAQGQIVQGQKASAGTSYAADVAGYYQQSIRISKQDIDLAVGANISNIGSKIAYTNTDDNDFIPINLRIGTSMGTDFDDYNKLSIAFDINKLLVPTPPEYDSNNNIVAGKEPNVAVVTGMFQSFGDAPGGAKEEFREINFSFGTEYWYADQFAVRAGYFNEHDTKGGRKYFTFGSGVKYNVFALDFSYLVNASRAINGNNPLANTMRFTLVFDFGAFQQEG